MIGWIFLIILFVLIVSACCFSDGSSSGNNASKKNVYRPNNTYHSNRNTYEPSYCECPSCGSPYYDGYCEECGYPDVNQGGVGENY